MALFGNSNRYHDSLASNRAKQRSIVSAKPPRLSIKIQSSQDRLSINKSSEGIVITTPETPPFDHLVPSLAPPALIRHSKSVIQRSSDFKLSESSKSIQRLRSSERTRNWAREIGQQRWSVEPIISVREDSDLYGSVGSDVFDSLIEAMNGTVSPVKHLKTAQEVITAREARFPHRRRASFSDEESLHSEIETPMVPKNRVISAQQRKDCTYLFDSPGTTSEKIRTLSTRTPGSKTPETRTPNSGKLDVRTPVSLLERARSGESSPIPTIAEIVRAHSPAPSLRAPILSIEDIIRRHSASVTNAEEAATAKARREMTQTPKSAEAPQKALPIIPVRTSSTPEKTAALSPGIPPRSSSKHDTYFAENSDSEVTKAMAMGQALLDQLESGVRPSTPSSVKVKRQSTPSARLVSPALARTASTTSSRHRSSSPLTPVEDISDAQAMALYLRSPKLTRLITLKNLTHRATMLTVSLADVGSPTGRPVVIFLGLGCVRYLIALYDELATVFGLRLICIDRWGLGRTDEIPQEKRSLLGWAEVVEGVMDELGIDTFQVLAHSAGTPYALASALRLNDRIKGKIHLLAPWVSSDVDGGYKWLKWVPNGVLKTAQAAEWRLQSYMLGKPPPVTYKPIEYDARGPVSSDSPYRDSDEDTGNESREYDKLGDFHNSFGSVRNSPAPGLVRKVSQSLFGTNSTIASVSPTTPLGRSPGMKNLRSISRNTSYLEYSPSLGEIDFGLGEGFDTFATDLNFSLQSPGRASLTMERSHKRSSVDQSILHRPRTTTPTSRPSASASSPSPINPADLPTFAKTLLQASHAECLNGTTADLLTILNRGESKPWGFDYRDIRQASKVWWGTEDDKISEKSVRWMQREMGCEVEIVKGEGHGLMTVSKVMFDVFESLSEDKC